MIDQLAKSLKEVERVKSMSLERLKLESQIKRRESLSPELLRAIEEQRHKKAA